MLTGTLPFTAESHESLIYQKLHDDPVSLEQRRQDIPQWLRFAVHRAMHRDKAVRYDSWKSFCDDLANALPLVPRPEETSFDSAHFNVLRNLDFFGKFSDTELWETVGISCWRRNASAGLQAAFSKAFLLHLIKRLREADQRYLLTQERVESS